MHRPRNFDWDRIIKQSNSYQACDVLIEARYSLTYTEGDECWLALVGRYWELIDGPRVELVEAMRNYLDGVPSLLLNLMNDVERHALTALPEVLTVWRGAYLDVNTAGISYSLSRDVASIFPFRGRYRMPGHEPVLLEARVRRDQCALKLGRNEQEIVTFEPQVVSVTPMAEPPIGYEHLAL